MGEREIPDEVFMAENRLNSETRLRVDELKTYLHELVTDLDRLINEHGEDVLKAHMGSTRFVQARQYIGQINQLLGNKDRARIIIEDALSSVNSSVLHRELTK